MRTLRAVVSYDGTDFAGFQRQANARSVQQVFEEALAQIEGCPVVVSGAGRTDSGVHALGQVVSFKITNPISPGDLKQALNAAFNTIGATDLRVIGVEAAPERFNARFDAVRKLYRYRIVNADLMNPFERRFAWHVPRELNLDLMRRASAPLVGEHDFSAFQAAGGDIKTSVRRMFCAQWHEAAREDGDRLLTFEIAGSGFLKYMVRSIVGTLVEIGVGRKDAGTIDALLSSGDRSKVGPTAPPHGLYLVRVDYGEPGPVSSS